MPLYKWECPHCKKVKKRILSPDEAEQAVVLCDCGEQDGPPCVMERQSGAPSTQIIETLDNGVMSRKVERLANAEQIFRERAHGKKGAI